MLLCPIQNTASFSTAWIQKRPRITQKFGENFRLLSGKLAYTNMDGHNGIDFGLPVGTPIFAPCDGFILRKDDKTGYGKHVKIRSREAGKEVVLGHLSNFVGNDNYIKMGDLIGYSGNTGFSTAPHLHFGMRFLQESSANIWAWKVKDHSNGYFGYIDILPYIITWKGGFLENDF